MHNYDNDNQKIKREGNNKDKSEKNLKNKTEEQKNGVGVHVFFNTKKIYNYF